MIKVANLDLLSINEGIVVHGCNAQGVMGAGIAKQFRDKYPEMYQLYRNYCMSYGNGPSLLGSIFWYQDSKLWIANAITQLYYGRDKTRAYVSYHDIERCFNHVNQVALTHNLPVYFPKIGAGLGNGNWDIIAEIIDRTLDDSLEKTLCVI